MWCKMYLISQKVSRGASAELWRAGVERSVIVVVVSDLNLVAVSAASSAPFIVLVVVVKVQRGDVFAEHDHISIRR